jgi:hypothetical protein
LAGGKVYYYIPSTTTFKNTYQNIALTILNTNPIILDSAGECIAYGNGTYRQVVYDVNNNLIWDQPTISIVTNDASNVIYTPPFANSVSETVTAKLSETISVKDFGAIGDGTTDDTIAFQNAASAIKSNGGGTLTLIAGKTYLVYPTGSLNPLTTLLDFTNCNGVSIEGNGATIKIGADTTVRNCIQLNATSNVSIKNLNFVSTLQTLTGTNGVYWLVANHGANQILLQNLNFQYGAVGFQAQGIFNGQGVDSNRVRDIVALNLNFFSCYYPLNFQTSGDNFFARNIYTRNCGRSYFPYNVRNHDVYLDSQQGGPFTDVLLKVYADPSFSYNRLENIKLNYYSDGRYPGSNDQQSQEAMVAIDLQQNSATSTAAFVDNIDIQFNVEPSGSAKNQSLFTIRKYNFSANPDTTARGHQVINLNLSGTGRSLQNLLSDYISLFNRSPDDWSGDNAYNIKVSDFALGGINTQNAITFNTAPVKTSYGQCLIRDVSSDGLLNIIGSTAKFIGVENSSFSNYLCGSEIAQSYTPNWLATTNPSIGNGSLYGYYTLQNKLCTVVIELFAGSTTTFGSGIWYFTLPFAMSAVTTDSLGSALGLNSGVNFYTGVSIINIVNPSSVSAFLGGTAGNNINSLNPWTWKNGDTLKLQITYPIA